MDSVIDSILNGTVPTAAPHATQIAPYNIANYVTSALYIGLILWAVFNLYTHMSSRLLIDAPKMLFGHVIAWALVRTVFSFLPNTVWLNIRNKHVDLQVMLDILPEFLFLCIFSLLIAMWTNVFARSKHLQLRKPENILWITHGVLCGALLLGGAVLVIVVSVHSKSHPNSYSSYRMWESYWIIASAAVILLGTILFGIGVARSLSKMQIISDFLKRQASKVRLLIVVTFLGIIFKVVYNLAIGKAVNHWRNTHKGSHVENGFAAIIFFYFFLTDILPVAFILTVFISPRKSKRTASGREYIPYAETEVDSSDGLLSSEEAY